MGNNTTQERQWFNDGARVGGWLAFALAMGLASVLLALPVPEPSHVSVQPAEAQGLALPAPGQASGASNRLSVRASGSQTGYLPARADQLIVSKLRRPGNGLSLAQAAELAQVIVEEARRHQFEPALVMAVIHVESSGRTLAVSPVGALGLMQIMPPTGQELAARHGIPWTGPDTLLDPVVNVKLGVAYLRNLTDRYQDVSTALTAYNWGPGRIDRKIRSGQKLPTLYRDRVMRAYDSTRQEIAVGRS